MPLLISTARLPLGLRTTVTTVTPDNWLRYDLVRIAAGRLYRVYPPARQKLMPVAAAVVVAHVTVHTVVVEVVAMLVEVEASPLSRKIS